VLIQTAKDLDNQLASNDEGCRAQINASKAEKFRASLAEANYKAHLEKLKHKECV
jgi:hypothetical protein